MQFAGGVTDLLSGVLGNKGANPMKGGVQQMDLMIQNMAIFTVAHEVAHQYFAGLLGSDCRGDPAFDEPLAQYAAGEYIKKLKGPVEGQKLFDTNVKMNYGVYRMIGGADMAAAQPVSQFPSALAYAAIVYGKAPYYYLALKRKLGAKRFDQALKATVIKNRFKLISRQQWLYDLEKAVGGPETGVRSLARRWFEESHGDEDLGVDDSGDIILQSLLGAEALAQLKQNLTLLGMKPKDLFRTILGNML